jgi:hypothetical protein
MPRRRSRRDGVTLRTREFRHNDAKALPISLKCIALAHVGLKVRHSHIEAYRFACFVNRTHQPLSCILSIVTGMFNTLFSTMKFGALGNVAPESKRPSIELVSCFRASMAEGA